MKIRYYPSSVDNTNDNTQIPIPSEMLVMPKLDGTVAEYLAYCIKQANTHNNENQFLSDVARCEGLRELGLFKYKVSASTGFRRALDKKPDSTLLLNLCTLPSKSAAERKAVLSQAAETPTVVVPENGTKATLPPPTAATTAAVIAATMLTPPSAASATIPAAESNAKAEAMTNNIQPAAATAATGRTPPSDATVTINANSNTPADSKDKTTAVTDEKILRKIPDAIIKTIEKEKKRIADKKYWHSETHVERLTKTMKAVEQAILVPDTRCSTVDQILELKVKIKVKIKDKENEYDNSIKDILRTGRRWYNNQSTFFDTTASKNLDKSVKIFQATPQQLTTS